MGATKIRLKILELKDPLEVVESALKSITANLNIEATLEGTNNSTYVTLSGSTSNVTKARRLLSLEVKLKGGRVKF
jgi:hypothetical protein